MRKAKPIYMPGQVIRMVRKGLIADPQPRGEGAITCEPKGHAIVGDTESPTFWENGSYVFCSKCKRCVLPRIEFATFTIKTTGERKKYPLYAPWGEKK